MDLTAVDLEPLIQNGITVKPGEEVIVIDNKPESPNSVENLAKILNIIPYEIVTTLGSRITRTIS